MSVLLSLEPTSVVLGGVVLLCVLWWLSTRRPSSLPPGPGPALPLLGHLHLLAKDPRPQFWEWRHKYGDVFSLYMGGRLVVVLASYSAIREAFINFADIFSHRPRDFISEYLCKRKGITATSGPEQKEQRKTTQEIFRVMGVGRNELAEKIQEEITHYIWAIKDHQGAPMDITRMTQASVCNNICFILFGKRYDYQDPEFIYYTEIIEANFKALKGSTLLHFFPVLRRLPGDPFRGQELIDNMDKLRAFVAKHAAGRQESADTDTHDTGHIPDFIEGYMRQTRKLRNSGTVDTSLNEENLVACVVDLFTGGTETTSTVIRWALLFFLHHPDVQDRCFQEISQVIGLHRLPAQSDKLKLPFVEATMLEVLRRADIGPMAVPHAPAQDVSFRGYTIPKGTMIIPFLSSAHQDPEIWGDPENFRPERFLGPDGKPTKREELIPFSTGRRTCIGESLARMEVFLYLTSLVQHFLFLPAEEGQLPSLEGVLGLTLEPQPYKLRAVPRM